MEDGTKIRYDAAVGKYVEGDSLTATGTTPTVGRTLAVDPYFIPRAKPDSYWKRATVSITGAGDNLVAEDGGEAIVGYRIDVFRGVVKQSLSGWTNGSREVRLISVN